MPRLLALLVVCGLAACSSLTRTDPPAEPLAVVVVEDVDDLADYLKASEVDLLTVRHVSYPLGRRNTPSTLLEFSDGGRCLVLTYESAGEAEQNADISVAERAWIRSSTAPRSRVTAYEPTCQIGPLVVSCTGEDRVVSQLLQSLEASDRSSV